MRAGWGLLLVVLLAGCAGDYQTFEPPPLDFSGQPTLRFAVERIDIESAYRSPGAPPFVEHTLALTPEAAMRAYLEQKLQAVGGPGRLQAVIVDASVKETALEIQRGVRGLLTAESSARLDGRMRVRVERFDAAGNAVASVGTAASLSRFLPEDVAYGDRQRIGYELVRELIGELATGLASNLRESFSDILRP
jgi:hypothetical protein